MAVNNTISSNKAIENSQIKTENTLIKKDIPRVNSYKDINVKDLTSIGSSNINYKLNSYLKHSNSNFSLINVNTIYQEFHELYDESGDNKRDSSYSDSTKYMYMSSGDLEKYQDVIISKNQFLKLLNEEKLPKDLLQEKLTKSDYELNYIDSGINLRHSYLNKLKQRGLLSSEKSRSHNSIIIFDWDDTLLCTSHLFPNNIFKDNLDISKKDFSKLSKIDEVVYKILTFALENSLVYIITNSAPGWVEMSSQKFFPKSFELLKKLTIVSARGLYESKFPNDAKQWKIQAFIETCCKLNLNLVTNLICLGDSIIEIEAAHILASKFSNAFIKTVKFKEAPKPEELLKQLITVLDQINIIFSTVKNITIRVEKKLKPK